LIFPESFKTSDGLTLRCSLASPVAPLAAVVVVHGLGDHREALPYRLLRTFLTERGVSVYSFDLRGHGESGGPRMFVPCWHTFREDLRSFLGLIGRPVFLCGMSLGGLIALDFAQQEPSLLRGVIALAPALVPTGVPPVVRWLLPRLSRIAPRLQINPRLDPHGISRDTPLTREYVADPLFQSKTTPRLAAEVLTAMERTRAFAPRLRLPLLILHGEADTIVPAAGSALFVDACGSGDKTRITYPGARHNLLIETNREEVFGDLAFWVLDRCHKRSLGGGEC